MCPCSCSSSCSCRTACSTWSTASSCSCPSSFAESCSSPISTTGRLILQIYILRFDVLKKKRQKYLPLVFICEHLVTEMRIIPHLLFSRIQKCNLVQTGPWQKRESNSNFQETIHKHYISDSDPTNVIGAKLLRTVYEAGQVTVVVSRDSSLINETLMATLLSIPLWVHLAVIGLWSPQLIWFHRWSNKVLKYSG